VTMSNAKPFIDGPTDARISLSLKDAAEVGRLLRHLVPRHMRTPSLERLLLAEDLSDAEPRGLTNDPSDLTNLATDIFTARRRRLRFFEEEMFGEPAWDMLLALYINNRSGEVFTVSRLLQFAQSPPTSALRWLNYLERKGLVRRDSHPNDGRSSLIRLTAKGLDALNSYLYETLKPSA
jgi:DNA-binding MarR family transcriptional regulator